MHYYLWTRSTGLRRGDRVRLVNNLLGLPLVEAERIVSRLILQDGALRADDIAGVVTAKRAEAFGLRFPKGATRSAHSEARAEIRANR